jgi:hypothetical protein
MILTVVELKQIPATIFLMLVTTATLFAVLTDNWELGSYKIGYRERK